MTAFLAHDWPSIGDGGGTSIVEALSFDFRQLKIDKQLATFPILIKNERRGGSKGRRGDNYTYIEYC
jgi:hypothetical protein